MPVNVKAMIADSFVQMSKEKDIDKITVKDLVERCNISRQSFYYHFQDLLEVIEWSVEQAFQSLSERSLEMEDSGAVLDEFMTAADEADALMQKLLHSQKREQIEQILAKAVRAYLQEQMQRKNLKTDIPYEDMEMALSFYTYGIVGLMIERCGKKRTDRKRVTQQMRRLLTAHVREQTETE